MFFAFYAFYIFLEENPWVTGAGRQGPAPTCHPRIFLQKSITKCKNINKKMSQTHCKTQGVWRIFFTLFTFFLKEKIKKCKQCAKLLVLYNEFGSFFMSENYVREFCPNSYEWNIFSGIWSQFFMVQTCFREFGPNSSWVKNMFRNLVPNVCHVLSPWVKNIFRNLVPIF